ncbi:MAG: DUF58 domain-containing protein [Lachnospiraceae bacterium]|nr:DUF58 domain-containing protein [Lachnospiraceae bacterium]
MKVRRCLLAGLWILSLTAISFYGGAVSYGFFFGVTMIPVSSLIYLFCVYFRFKIYQETEKKSLVCGQPTPYLFILKNEDYFAYTGISVRMHSSFSYAEDTFENVEYELLPGDKTVCETKIVCKYRGEYEIGVREVVMTDFFRLFLFRYAVSGQIKAVVLPKIVQLEELKSIADLPMLVQRDATGSREPDILVRDYVEGDSLKQVHWKATAREQKLKVRVMTGKENQGIFVFCDTRRYSEDMKEFLPLENKILETFLAVSYYFAGTDKEFDAYYGQNGIVKKHVEGINSFDEFYHTVSEIRFGNEESPRSVLEHVMGQGILWGSNLVFCILHELSAAIMDATERLAASGVIVVIYVIADQVPKEYMKQGSTRRRIVVIPVEAELEGRL